jgi:D-alanyl-D-alanine carboxypeptidase
MLNNDNLLLRTYQGDIGGKVGYTDDAQQTYANAAQRDGHRIALVMTRGTNHIVGRWQNARELMNYGFALEKAHAAPVGFIVAPRAGTGAPSADNVVKQAVPTTGHGNAQVATAPQGSMSTFGNVGLPLTILAAVGLVLIGLLYLKRQKAKKARAVAAARVASAETIRVALPPDLANRSRSRSTEEITQSIPATSPTPAARQRSPQGPRTGQGMPSVNHPAVRATQPRSAAAPRPAQRPVNAPRTNPAPEWPSSPEWPT